MIRFAGNTVADKAGKRPNTRIIRQMRGRFSKVSQMFNHEVPRRQPVIIRLGSQRIGKIRIPQHIRKRKRTAIGKNCLKLGEMAVHTNNKAFTLGLGGFQRFRRKGGQAFKHLTIAREFTVHDAVAMNPPGP